MQGRDLLRDSTRFELDDALLMDLGGSDKSIDRHTGFFGAG